MRTTSPITDAMIAQYEHPYMEFELIEADGSRSQRLTDDDIASGSFSYKQSCMPNGRLEVGGCNVSYAQFTILNYDYPLAGFELKGAKVKIYMGYGANKSSATYDQIATVFVNDYSFTGNAINVSCYDILRKGDEIKFAGIYINSTLYDILQSACTQIGVTTAIPSAVATKLRAIDATIYANTASLTCRQVIQYIAQCVGCFAYINNVGALVLKWFSSTVNKTYDDAYGSNTSDSFRYTGIQIDGREISGVDDTVYVLNGNPLITDDNYSTVETNIRSALIGFSSYDFSADVLADPRIEVGDLLEIPVTSNNEVNLIQRHVMGYTIKGSMKQSISSEAPTRDEVNDKRVANNPKDILSEAETYTDNKVKTVQEAVDEIKRANASIKYAKFGGHTDPYKSSKLYVPVTFYGKSQNPNISGGYYDVWLPDGIAGTITSTAQILDFRYRCEFTLPSGLYFTTWGDNGETGINFQYVVDSSRRRDIRIQPVDAVTPIYTEKPDHMAVTGLKLNHYGNVYSVYEYNESTSEYDYVTKLNPDYIFWQITYIPSDEWAK